MWHYPEFFDVIVIGGGHAGIEAAHASAKMGATVLLLTANLDTIGKASCNPSIGGTAKGHLVREIDAIGGLMGKLADKTGIHCRMLNRSKGPAVWSPRCQIDKTLYQTFAKKALEELPSLTIHQGTVLSFQVTNGEIQGITTKEDVYYQTKSVILSSGTFMQGLMHIGSTQNSGGRAGDAASNGLSHSLETLGIKLGRLKTGTPCRVNAHSIDFTNLEKQPPETPGLFSFDPVETPATQIPCYITYTTKKTQEVIESNLHLSPLVSGQIKGLGPRYCPSIEDKIIRFPDKERHQLFLEQEGLHTHEIYVNGISSCFPQEIQYAIMKTIPGFENVKIMRPAYAIEYDYVISGQIHPTLETQTIKGLYFAGQINGTTGYEEAAAQGLIAGINAVLKIRNSSPFILSRGESYIGVMIDDLLTHTIHEPYRIFTSRAEFRLLLRQDNADLRLRKYGYQFGLIQKNVYEKLLEKQEIIEREKLRLKNLQVLYKDKKVIAAKLLCNPEISYTQLQEEYPDLFTKYREEIQQGIEIDLKFEGYIKREAKEVQKLHALEKQTIPENFKYENIQGLKQEAKDRLQTYRPSTIGQASRIFGVSPADISILIVALKNPKVHAPAHS